jgi:flagellar biosynthetic protein FliR
MFLGDKIFGLLLVATRVSALMVFAPVLNSAAIPARVKVGITITITALLAWAQPARVAALGNGWALGLAGELLIGLVLGLVVNLVFEAAQLSGQILGFQLGYSLVNVIDPQTQVDSPVLSVFHQMLTVLIFLQLDVHHWLLRGLARSFAYLPAGTAVFTPLLARGLLQAFGGVWLAGVQIAAPALAATMLADVAIGLLGKASPQLPLMLVAIPVKACLGLLVMSAGLIYWPSWFAGHFELAVAYSERLLGIGS